MLIISSRKKFWDSNIVTSKKTDRIRNVNLPNLSDSSVSAAQFTKQIKGKRILLLIHGYNNEPHDVMRAYKTVEKYEKEFINYYDLIIGYTWPGGDQFWHYGAAKNRVGVVSSRVKSLITKMISNCKEVDIMSHSMGCRISLMLVNDLQENAVRKNIMMRLYLLAAAVDNESIEKDERYYEGSTYCDNTYIFHSKKDPTLFFGKTIWEKNNALGCTGPENPGDIHSKVKVINCKKIISKHGAYKNADSIFKFIKKELTGSKRAPQFSTL